MEVKLVSIRQTVNQYGNTCYTPVFLLENGKIVEDNIGRIIELKRSTKYKFIPMDCMVVDVFQNGHKITGYAIESLFSGEVFTIQVPELRRFMQMNIINCRNLKVGPNNTLRILSQGARHMQHIH